MADDAGVPAKTARELTAGIRLGTYTAREIAEKTLAHIRSTNPDINAFITLDEDGALRAADTLDKKVKTGNSVGPLAGIPIALKDVLCSKGLRTTCASKILDNFIGKSCVNAPTPPPPEQQPTQTSSSTETASKP